MKFATAFTTIALLAITTISSAQSLTSYVAVGAGNTGFENFGINAFASDFSGIGTTIVAAGNETFSGIDGNGDSQTMSFAGTALASAQYGILRTYATGNVTNSFYNSNNPWYYNSDTGSVNHNGTPDYLISFGQAQYNDVFTYTNIGPAVTVNFFYQITGTFSGGAVYHSILVENDEDFDSIILTPNDGNTINQTFVTKNFSIGDGILNHSTNILSQFDHRTEFSPDGTNISGVADFDSTVILTGMVLKDANGAVVNGWSFNSGSGADYGAVPEPATMTILALAALIAKNRKK
ncbi:hypothetical protein C0431_14060 [bacterium]|nr:hypothetical protein [bacterium]